MEAENGIPNPQKARVARALDKQATKDLENIFDKIRKKKKKKRGEKGGSKRLKKGNVKHTLWRYYQYDIYLVRHHGFNFVLADHFYEGFGAGARHFHRHVALQAGA